MRHNESESSGAWKKIAAVVLCGGAAVFALGQFARLRPEPPSPAPLASQWERQDAAKIDAEYAAGLTAAGLTEKQQEALRDWERRRPDGGDAAARQAHRAGLDALLTKEQQDEYRRLEKERGEKRAALREARNDRLKGMIGEKDFERHQADMKKVREAREARKQPK